MKAAKNSVALYSCYFGNPEPFNPSSLVAGEGYDCILFTDRQDIAPEGVRLIRQNTLAFGPAWQSRKAKMLPHQELTGYEWAIYVDNRTSLKLHPSKIIRKISANFKDEPPAGKHLFRHPERSNIWEELHVCLMLGHINEREWRDILALYERVDLPSDHSLTHNAIMIYKMGDRATERAGQLWFELFLRYSKRDQLTLHVADHLAQCSSQLIDFPLREIADWPVYDDGDRDRATRPKYFRKPPFFTVDGIRYRIRRARMTRLIRTARQGS